MAIQDVTQSYVNLLTSDMYEDRVSNTAEFEALKQMYSVYLNDSPCNFPDKKYTHALALLLAHHYQLYPLGSGQSGGSSGEDPSVVGSIIQQKVGDVTITYGDFTASTEAREAWLMQSTWGAQFLALMQTFRSSPWVTGVNPNGCIP